MFRGNDILKIYDDDYNNIGKATREEVHHKGLLHQVAHLWMFQKQTNDTYILFQKRSYKRELYPGKYDLIQTTHFDPDESYEEAIVHSMDYYLGSKMDPKAIIHIGSTRQHIDQNDYHDNALVQVFVATVSKALFIMPDTEEIVKVHYQDFCDLVHGRTDGIQVYSLDDIPLRKTLRDEWWIREDEFFDVLEPYIDSKLHQ
jgi:isopentenyldiphosphate isomerase